MNDNQIIEQYLQSQNISQELIQEISDFRMKYDMDPLVEERLAVPEMPFIGTDILEMAITAILRGQNLLLSGAKATGKNVLCETLAWIFGRPSYDISFHVNTDSASLIGAIQTMKSGLAPLKAVQMGIVNKSFDLFEKEIIQDVVKTRIPASWGKEQIFEV